MSYGKNITSSFITQVIMVILSFATSVLVVRQIGVGGKGDLAYIHLITGMVAEYGHLGITYSLPYFYKKTNNSPDTIFNTNIIVIIFISLTVFIVGIGAKISGNFEYNWALLLIMLVTIASSLFVNFFTTYYVADEIIYKVNRINVVNNMIKTLALLALVLFKRISVTSYLLVELLFIIISLPLLIKNIKVYKINFSHFSKTLLIRELKFGALIYFGNLFITLNYRLDKFLIKAFLDKNQLAIYDIGVSLAEMLFLVPSSVANAITGRLYNISSDKAQERKITTAMTVKYVFIATFILAIIGIAFAPILPILYKKDFAPSVMPARILFIGIAFASIGKVSGGYFQSAGKPYIHCFVTLGIFLINLVFNLILIPILGINGAAIASTFSYVSYGVIYVMIFVIKEGFPKRYLFGITEYDKDIYRMVKDKCKKLVKKR